MTKKREGLINVIVVLALKGRAFIPAEHWELIRELVDRPSLGKFTSMYDQVLIPDELEKVFATLTSKQLLKIHNTLITQRLQS